MKTQESTKNNILNKALKDKHEEQELNMIAARNNKEHSTKIGMKTMSILDKRWSVFFSQTMYARVQLVMNSKQN